MNSQSQFLLCTAFGLTSPCQKMSWPCVLIAALQGSHQAPCDLPTVQATVVLIVHCAATFLQSALRILYFLTLYIKSEPSLAGPSQTSASNTQSEYITLLHPTSRCTAKKKNEIFGCERHEKLYKADPGFIFSKPKPCHSPRLLLWWEPSGNKVLQFLLHVLSSQLPSLHFVILGGCVNLELPLYARPARLKLAAASHCAAHKSTYTPV